MNPKADTPATAATSPGSPSQAPGDLSTLPLAEVQKALATSPDGLTGATAQTRLARYGPNELPEKKTNALLQFLSYFWGPIPWMIEAAVVLSAVARHWPAII
jgi:H+-transporting ATPase